MVMMYIRQKLQSIIWQKLPADDGLKADNGPKELEYDFVLPQNEDEAVKRGIELLRKLRFRANRAAEMNYLHSTEYGSKVKTITNFATVGMFLTPFISVIIRYPSLGCIVTAMKNRFAPVIVPGYGLGLFWFYYQACPNLILSHYKEKEMRHNNAGAAWQALEINIEAYLETSVVEITSRRIRRIIQKFTDERKEACKIACPEKEMRERVTQKPEKTAERMYQLDLDYNIYKQELVRLEQTNNRETKK